MSKTIFEQIYEEAQELGKKPTFKYFDWYKDRVLQLAIEMGYVNNPFKIVKDEISGKFDSQNKSTANLVSRAPLPGKLCMFYYYDPKYKYTLPVYDALPLIYVIDSKFNPAVDEEGPGFTGINLHYLPRPDQRIKNRPRLNFLNDIRNTGSAQAPGFTFHRYLAKYVKSEVVEITPSNWNIAIELPIEQFWRDIGGVRKSIPNGSVWKFMATKTSAKQRELYPVQ